MCDSNLPPIGMNVRRSPQLPPLPIKRVRNASDSNFVSRGKAVLHGLQKQASQSQLRQSSYVSLQQELDMFTPKVRQIGRMEDRLDRMSMLQLEQKRQREYQEHLDYLKAAEKLGLWKALQ